MDFQGTEQPPPALRPGRRPSPPGRLRFEAEADLLYLPGPASSLPGTVPALPPGSGDLCGEKEEQ